MGQTQTLQFLVLCTGYLALTGCFGLSESKFIAQVNTLQCERMEECASDYFEDEYSDLDDCVDEYSDAAPDYLDYYDDCDYDRSKAKDCLADYRDADCDTNILDDCLEVWDCD